MLSQEIYDSWNAKTLSDLNDLLDNLGAPKIPSDVQSNTFKAAVLKRIEKRRVAERRKSIEPDFDFFNYDEPGANGCCAPCSCLKKKSKRPSKIFDCKTLDVFEKICEAAAQRFTRSISSVKALIQKLSYWESIKPGTDGLSVIGGYIWLLSYTCQHLIDSPSSRDEFRMQAHIIDIKELYQVLSQAGELFNDMAEAFHENTYNMRMDGLLVLKKLSKKWKISDDHNPLLIRHEHVRCVPRPRKRLGCGLECPCDTEEDDDVFSVKWSPLIVFIQVNTNEKIKPFAKLHPHDRVTIFRKFMKHTLNQVEMDAEDLTLIAKGLQQIVLDVELNPTHSGREITAAMLEFCRGKHCPKSLDVGAHKRVVYLLNEFWYSLDVLYENVFILSRLIEETRDIIRTCYVYTDIFYKWYMPSYDSFMSKNKPRRSERGSSSSNTVMNAKEILYKFGNPSEKKLSETTSILSLMDFSSSIYQGVVQEIPVLCEGMVLSLKTNEAVYGTHAEEPMGLLKGIVDKRKSGVIK